MRRVPMLLVALACSEPTVDLRYHTPRATIDTLLDSYGVLEIPQEEIDRRMRIGRTFHLNDPASMSGCFVDWTGPADEGLVGYVFGSLASAKDRLRIIITNDTARIVAERGEGREGRPVVMRLVDGAWRIVLRESVPREAQRALSKGT